MDEEFNREEKKFVNLEKAVRTLVRNISTYLEQVQVKIPQNVMNHCGLYAFVFKKTYRESLFFLERIQFTGAQLSTQKDPLPSTRSQLPVYKCLTLSSQGSNFRSTRVQLPVHMGPISGPQGPTSGPRTHLSRNLKMTVRKYSDTRLFMLRRTRCSGRSPSPTTSPTTTETRATKRKSGSSVRCTTRSPPPSSTSS